MTYAVGNTLLTIWGMVIVLMLVERILIPPRPREPPKETIDGRRETARSTRSWARSRSRTSSPRWRRKAAQESSIAYLNAGRGNPNWIATEPREAFFLLGQFAVTESKRVLDLPPGVGGMPQATGIAGRLEAWLDEARRHAGCALPAGDGAVGGEEVRLRRRQVRARAGRLDHRRQLPGAGPHAGAQRADRARVPAVGDVRRRRGRRASSSSTRSRAAPPPCATSSSR